MRFILLGLCAHFTLAQAQTWSQLADFPGTARDDAAAFSTGTSICIGTGMEVGWGLTSDWSRYDAGNDTWHTMAALPASGRQYCTAFSVDGIGYLFGGTDGSGWLNELWAYDPQPDAWQQRASLPGTGRSGSVAFVIDGSGYVTNGRTGASTLSNELWRYDPAQDAWTALAPMPGEARQLAAAFAIGGHGYVVAGANEQGAITATAWRYDALSDEWDAIADLPDARFGADGFSGGGKGLVIGGAASLELFLDAAYWYDPLLDEWSAAPALAAARKGGSGSVVDGDIYFGTGVNATQRFKDWHKLTMPVGIDAHALDTAPRLHPRPVTDVAMLDLPGGLRIHDATIIDLQGRVVERLVPQALQRPIALAHLRPGHYVLHISHAEGAFRERFLLIGTP
ncbi:MAG: hypothetical protein KF797_02845 [Flavobacteriales bacterium]|nr:hypothetical protein [Flavobacteriales bacterium]